MSAVGPSQRIAPPHVLGRLRGIAEIDGPRRSQWTTQMTHSRHLARSAIHVVGSLKVRDGIRASREVRLKARRRRTLSLSRDSPCLRSSILKASARSITVIPSWVPEEATALWRGPTVKLRQRKCCEPSKRR